MALTFSLRTPLQLPLDFSRVAQQIPQGSGPDEWKRIRVPCGNTTTELGELFQILGEADNTLQVWEGDFSSCSGIGAGHESGTIRIEGNVGNRAGARMRGGDLIIRGHAGDGLGSAMAGGRIFVEGNSGERAGAAETPSERGMTGGQILIAGDAGPLAGFRMRRGDLIIGGTAGPLAGFQMIAGSLLMGQTPQDVPGLEMRRGTVLCLDSQLASSIRHPRFHESGQFLLGAVDLLALRYQRLLQVPELQNADRYAVIPALGERSRRTWRLFYGDHLHGGRGEILVAS